MTDERCDFCGRDPYEWVDIGVGFERVAITCCDEGINAYYAARDSDQSGEAGETTGSTEGESAGQRHRPERLILKLKHGQPVYPPMDERPEPEEWR